MNRAPRLSDLVGAVIAIVIALLGHYLYIRETVIRHDEQIKVIEARLTRFEAKQEAQFDKIESALASIQKDITEVKLDLKDKADRPTTTSK